MCWEKLRLLSKMTRVANSSGFARSLRVWTGELRVPGYGQKSPGQLDQTIISSQNHLKMLCMWLGHLFINLQKLFATKPFTRNHISCSRNALKLTYSKVENQKFPLDPRFRGGMGGEGNLSQGLSCQVVGNPRRYTQSNGFKLVRQKDELI